MKYYLVGEKLGHSFSADIHMLNGLDYELKEVKREDIGRLFEQKDFDGLNVTMPYKKAVIPYLDEVDETALEIGAVNTVVNENGRLKGFNTDCFGLEYALSAANLSLKGENVLILGKGGGAAVARYVARKQGALSTVVVGGRKEIEDGRCYDFDDATIVINATPVGMFPNEDKSPLDLFRMPRVRGIFDLVYNPLRTKLSLHADLLGIKNACGLTMLVAQGLYSEYLWGKNDEYLEKIAAQTESIRRERQNIVLIGAPSAGKSTIGALVAKKTGRKFFDVDLEIEKATGKTPERIIENLGEENFRKREREVVEKLKRERGAVIACGGGTVLDERNVVDLKQNGLLIYLERDADKLSSVGRPLSKNGAISRLLSERIPIYERASDVKIKNDDELEVARDRVIFAAFRG